MATAMDWNLDFGEELSSKFLFGPSGVPNDCDAAMPSVYDLLDSPVGEVPFQCGEEDARGGAVPSFTPFLTSELPPFGEVVKAENLLPAAFPERVPSSDEASSSPFGSPEMSSAVPAGFSPTAGEPSDFPFDSDEQRLPSEDLSGRGDSGSTSPSPPPQQPPKRKRKARAPIPVSQEEVDELEEMGLPEHLLKMARRPMTHDELRYFKKERRLFKNKLSAQLSRERRKDYMDGLESKVDGITRENKSLKRKIDDLETKNTDLNGENSYLKQELDRLTSILKQVVPAGLYDFEPSEPPAKRKRVEKKEDGKRAGAVLMIMLLSFGMFVNFDGSADAAAFGASPGGDHFHARAGGRVLLWDEDYAEVDCESGALDLDPFSSATDQSGFDQTVPSSALGAPEHAGVALESNATGSACAVEGNDSAPAFPAIVAHHARAIKI